MIETAGKEMLSQSKFYTGYSRWRDEDNRHETWDEAVERVMDMHRAKYADRMTPELADLINFAEQAYKDKRILGAQRALQFGGDQLFAKNARMYNCSVCYADKPEFFQETIYLLLCGCGVGFSVQKQHVQTMPKIKERFHKRSKVFTVPDTIEGWADAFGILVSSYMEDGGKFPEYKGCKVHFDYSKIRPKGAKISGGFLAPGPDGLRDSLNKCEDLLDRETNGATEAIPMRPIVIYDLVMHGSNAVLSGGVRRSATICVFSKDDDEMMKAKTGDWFVTNPQRGRSNNSVILKRDELTRDEWASIMESVKQVGEPGFIFTDNLDFLFNPCVTGDTLVTVRDHDVIQNGERVAEGQPYQIRMDQLVELYNTSELVPMVLSYNTETGAKEWKPILGAAMTREDAEVYEITDHATGKTVKATADHLIWTSNRGYVEVKDLEPTDELVIG